MTLGRPSGGLLEASAVDERCPHPRPRRYVAIASDQVMKRCAHCGADVAGPFPRCTAVVATAGQDSRRCESPTVYGDRCLRHEQAARHRSARNVS